MSKTLKISVGMALVLADIAAVGSTWWFASRGEPARALVLYGNVNLRQVALAFNNSDALHRTAVYL